MNWSSIKVGDAVKITKGKKCRECEFGADYAVRYIQIDDLRNDNNLKYTDDMQTICVKEEDIIIAWDGANAGTIGYKKSGAIGSTLARLKLTSEQLDTGYTAKFLISRFHEMRANCTGATIPHINGSHLKSMHIPLPPLEEQTRIATILDQADAIRKKRERSITLLDDFLRSTFLDMFGDPVTNPMGWDIAKLESICTKITDGTHDTPSRFSIGVPFITGKNIRPFELVLDDIDYVDENTHLEIYKRCNPTEGDVLYTNIGANVGTAALNRLDYEFSMKNVALLKPDPSMATGSYLEFVLNHVGFKERMLGSNSQGGAQKFLSLKMIRGASLPIPCIKQQHLFQSIYQNTYSLKTIQKIGGNNVDNLFSSLSQRAFSGELTDGTASQIIDDMQQTAAG